MSQDSEDLTARVERLEAWVDKAEISYGTVRYLGFLTHHRETLERLSVAIDWHPTIFLTYGAVSKSTRRRH